MLAPLTSRFRRELRCIGRHDPPAINVIEANDLVEIQYLTKAF